MSSLKKTLSIITVTAGAYIAVKSIKPIETTLSAKSLSWTIGNVTFSAYSVLESLIVMVLILTIGAWCSGIVEKRIHALEIRSSNREILIKFFYIFFYFIAFVITLKVLGVDLTTLTVIGGGAFIGLGFGLQKVAANFLTGFALLFEKSFEPGDVLELSDGTTGIVRHTGARYTLVETFGGKDVIVPNEEFFTNKVVNWTLSSSMIRVEVLFKIPYKYDLDEMRNLILEVAINSNNCLKNPIPVCLLKDVSDGMFVFALQFWIGNAYKGVSTPESELRMDVWRTLKQKGIESLAPQKDIRIIQ